MEILQIIEGWRNKLIPPKELRQMIQAVSQERKKTCDTCEWNSENRKKTHNYKNWRPYVHCVDCGCELEAKQKCLSCECPFKYWKAQMDKEEFDKLKTELDGQD